MREVHKIFKEQPTDQFENEMHKVKGAQSNCLKYAGKLLDVSNYEDRQVEWDYM